MSEYVNTQTGEIIEVRDNEEIKIQSPLTLEQAIRGNHFNITNKIKRDKDLEFLELQNNFFGETFVFLLYENFNLLLDNLDQADITRYMYIGSFCKNDGYLKHDNNKLIDTKALTILLYLSKSECNKLLKKLINLGLLIKDKYGYKVSSEFFHKGEKKKYKHPSNKLMTEQYFRLYINGIRNIYENTESREHKKVAILFKLVFNIHPKNNIICRYPDKELSHEFQPLNLKQIAEIVGYSDSNKMKEALLSFKINNKYIFMKCEVGTGKNKKNMFIVNPAILYRNMCPEQTTELLRYFGYIEDVINYDELSKNTKGE
jgi:hypothetical protein